VSLVRDAVVESLGLRASPANATVSDMYADGGPVQRRNLLAALDGLTSPDSRRNVGREKARLARLLRWNEDSEVWAKSKIERSPTPPPIDPLRLDAAVRASEVRHVEKNMSRLREWERKSPHHEA
jgi:hypothetical protein